MLTYERELYNLGYRSVCGVDEVGRGPLAGPVVAAAVILPHDVIIEGIDDSKKLSAKKREQLDLHIRNIALAYSICEVDNVGIDELGIVPATFKAMVGAVKDLATPPDYVLVDGNTSPDFGVEAEWIIKGDSKCQSIAAAAIIAKVHRDKLMADYDSVCEGYNFGGHKGYPTKAHYEAIEKHGKTPIHRLTFLKEGKGWQKR